MFQSISAITQSTQELIIQCATADRTVRLWLPLTHGWAVSLTSTSPQTKMDGLERHWPLCLSQMSVNQEKLQQSQWDYCTIKWMGEQDTASCPQHTKRHFKATLLIQQFLLLIWDHLKIFFFYPLPQAWLCDTLLPCFKCPKVWFSITEASLAHHLPLSQPLPARCPQPGPRGHVLPLALQMWPYTASALHKKVCLCLVPCTAARPGSGRGHSHVLDVYTPGCIHSSVVLGLQGKKERWRDFSEEHGVGQEGNDTTAISSAVNKEKIAFSY